MASSSTYFSPIELWFLFSQYAPATIIGLPDPTLGFLADEIREMVSQAQKSLQARGIVQPGTNGGWAIREPYLGLIRGVASPEHTILVTRQDAGSAEVLQSFHFTAKSILALWENGPGKYLIAEIKQADEIGDFLLGALLANVYVQRDEPAVTVSGKNLAKAHAHLENGQGGRVKALFWDSFQDPEQAERFVQAILQPITRLSLIAFLRRDQPELSATRGFSAIAGDEDIWLLTPENERADIVRVKSVTRMNLEETIHSFLPKQELAR